jgi:hypothetical protein
VESHVVGIILPWYGPRGGNTEERRNKVLGVPNVVDRVAQTVAVLALEPEVEKVFHEDSYRYRPGRSPVDAVAACRKRCWEKDWVVDLDVKAFFDTVSWDLTLKAVARHTDLKWVLLYVERWLKASMRIPDGTVTVRTQGTPQGGPISPLLANLFLHYGFDQWISREYPGVRFERFADDEIPPGHPTTQFSDTTPCPSNPGWHQVEKGLLPRRRLRGAGRRGWAAVVADRRGKHGRAALGLGCSLSASSTASAACARSRAAEERRHHPDSCVHPVHLHRLRRPYVCPNNVRAVPGADP